jgi:glycosyltransferase involved in cell wall biosynthesis
MLGEQLELLLITYNRAKPLERTLAQVLESPFAQCKITILDNRSSDDTPLVCEKYRTLFPRLGIMRHRKNIGASANYLRAVELSAAPYTWVLCDDDTFDFSDCADVVEVIERGDVDLIHTGVLGEFGWERGITTTSKYLTSKGTNYFFIFSFVPSLIFKTERFDSECIAKGYRISVNLYPHFEFLKKSVQENFSVYVSRRYIVHRGTDDSYFSGLGWFTLWVNNCRTIEDRRLRRAAIYELADTARNRALWLKNLALWIIEEKLHAPEQVGKQLGQIWFGFSGDQRLLLALLSPLALLPAPLYAMLRARRRAGRGKAGPAAKQPVDFFRF